MMEALNNESKSFRNKHILFLLNATVIEVAI